MPFLKIETNAEKLNDSQANAFIAAASELVSGLLEKPERYIMVSYQHNPDMMFDGKNNALAYVELKSLGLNEEQTTEYAAKICNFVKETLDVSPDRIYIEFTNAERHLWGWDNKTF